MNHNVAPPPAQRWGVAEGLDTPLALPTSFSAGDTHDQREGERWGGAGFDEGQMKQKVFDTL